MQFRVSFLSFFIVKKRYIQISRRDRFPIQTSNQYRCEKRNKKGNLFLSTLTVFRLLCHQDTIIYKQGSLTTTENNEPFKISDTQQVNTNHMVLQEGFSLESEKP